MIGEEPRRHRVLLEFPCILLNSEAHDKISDKYMLCWAHMNSFNSWMRLADGVWTLDGECLKHRLLWNAPFPLEQAEVALLIVSNRSVN